MVVAENVETSFAGISSIHAEKNVHLKYRKRHHDQTKYVMLIIRYNSKGQLAESKPCCACIKEIKSWTDIKIKNIYYSTKNNADEVVIISGSVDKLNNSYICRGNRKTK